MSSLSVDVQIRHAVQVRRKIGIDPRRGYAMCTYTHADTPVFFLRLPQVAFNFKEEDPLSRVDGIRE